MLPSTPNDLYPTQYSNNSLAFRHGAVSSLDQFRGARSQRDEAFGRCLPCVVCKRVSLSHSVVREALTDKDYAQSLCVPVKSLGW